MIKTLGGMKRTFDEGITYGHFRARISWQNMNEEPQISIEMNEKYECTQMDEHSEKVRWAADMYSELHILQMQVDEFILDVIGLRWPERERASAD